MKFIFIPIFFFTLSLNLSAQNASSTYHEHKNKIKQSKKEGTILWDMDTLYNKGVANCIVYVTVKKTGDFTHEWSDYKVTSLKGVDLLYMSYTELEVPKSFGLHIDAYTIRAGTQWVEFHTLNFLDSNYVCEIPQLAKTKVPQFIIGNNLVTDSGTINVISRRNLVRIYGVQFSTKYGGINATNQTATTTTNQTSGTSNTAPATYTIVDRNKTALIFINGSSLVQDGKEIGVFEETQVTINNMASVKVTIYLSNGVKVAECTSPATDKTNWTIVRFKDVSSAVFKTNAATYIKEIANNLIVAGYL